MGAPNPIYIHQGERLNLEEARARLPDGLVYAGPQSEEDGVYYLVASEAELPDLAASLELAPGDLKLWLTLTLPPDVVFVSRQPENGGFVEEELTLDQLKELKNPTVLAGPHTEMDGRFFIFDPLQPVREQAEWIGLDPELMEEWWRSQNA